MNELNSHIDSKQSGSEPASDVGEAVLRRPLPFNGVELPCVRNIEEAWEWGRQFNAVLTAGPDRWEVRMDHPNHRVWAFEDTTRPSTGPSLKQVEEMISWGKGQRDLLVHCHAGMSRSTAVAWGICLARGLDPEDSLAALYAAHPFESWGERRLFIPNRLIVQHLEAIFDMRGLANMRDAAISMDLPE